MIIHRKGKYLIIEPIKRQSLLDFLKNQTVQAEDFPELVDPLPKSCALGQLSANPKY